jgi:hypothetical protein
MEIETVLLKRERDALANRLHEWRSRAPTGFNTIDDADDDLEASLENGDTLPEDEELTLPSSLPGNRERSQKLVDIEMHLRKGQANDCLEKIRTCLAHKLALSRQKKARARGQHENTRASNFIKRLHDQIEDLATQYQKAYLAMISLGMDANDKRYRAMEASDLKIGNRQDQEQIQPLGHTHTSSVSWIWYNTAEPTEDQHGKWLDESMSRSIQLSLVLMIKS